MRFWSNLIGYQLVWFSAVIGAGRGLAWTGVVAATVFVAAEWWASPTRSALLRLCAVALVCAAVVDGVLSASGWATHAAAWPIAGIAPAWILALWCAFASTLLSSMAVLQRRRVLALLLGAIGGPLAYLGAARGFSAITFIPPSWQGLAWLALGWGIALPLLASCAGHWQARATPPGDPPRSVGVVS